MKRTIGKMVYVLREEKGISQKNLADGLLSLAELSRIELGNRDEDSFVLAALFERLGKSIDKFEFLKNTEEYKLLCLRRLTEQALLEGKFRTAAVSLMEYKEYSKGSIHEQYYCQMRALNYYMVDKNREDFIKGLQKALSMTKPLWNWEKDSWENVYFCTQEIQLVLMLGCALMENAEFESALQLAKKIFAYVEKNYTDEEEKSKLYPKCAWLLSSIHMRMNNFGEAYRICCEGKQCLVQNGSLLFMDRLLKNELQCLVEMGREQDGSSVRSALEAIEFLYHMADYKPVQEKMLCMLLTNTKREITVSNEMLYELRNAYGFSQEELSWGICSRETLSRIESGKRSPHRKKLQALFDKLGEGRGSYYSYVVAEDYRIYEKVNLYKRYQFQKKTEQAYALLHELEQELDLTNPINRQFVENNFLMERVDKLEISYEEAVEELEEILRYTMKKFEGTIYRIPYREEFIILNCMALYMRYSGKRDEAEELFEQLLSKYKESQVEEIYHIKPLSLLYLNYAGLLEVNGKLDKAESIGKQGLKLLLEGQKGDTTGKIIGNLSCVYEKKKTKEGEQLCEECMRQSYRLLSLFGLQKDSIVIKEAYEKKYGTKIK